MNQPHDALRGLTTPPPGERPGILPEPVPQRSDRTVRRFAGAALPTPGLPVLAGALGEAVDPSALSFLVRRAVEDRKREEEEKVRKEKEAQEKADLELAKRDPWWAQRLADTKARSSRHKRKKKRKKRLPRSSPLPRRVCAGTSGAGEDWRIYPVFPQYPLVRVLPALPHGPVCSADHGDSSVAAYFGGRCPCCAGSCRFSVTRFPALLGSTVDLCYVSLQRLLWEIAEHVSFSAQCLVRQWIHGAASLRGHSTGAALGHGCRARCVRGKCPDPEAHHSGGAAVAVPLQGRQHPRRCAETASHGLTIQRPLRFSLLQYIDKAVDVGCASPASSLVQSVRRQSRSHSCSFDAGHCRSHACCCATTGAWAGRDSAETVGFRSWHCLLDRLMTCPPACRLFRAVCTRTRPGADPRHQGGEGVAGTPGSLLPGVLPPN